MAHVYIDSNAAGAGTGADWANAYTTLSAALSGSAVAGNNFWVAQDHAESTAGAVTLTSPGTAAAPCTVACVNKAGSVPPVSADLATTATVTTTGANGISVAAPTTGWTFWRGITFNVGTGASAASLTLSGPGRFRNCAFVLGTSATTSTIVISSAGPAVQDLTWDNCTVQFGHASQTIVGSTGRFLWKNTPSAIAGATIPTNLFTPTQGQTWMLEAVDLTALSTNALAAAGMNRSYRFILKDCKVGAISLPTPTGSGGLAAQEIILARCDSGATNYRHEKVNYAGKQSIETTIVRTGGATDGTTPIAWKIETTANSELLFPFECMPITVWNETVGSVTVTVHGIWGDGAVPDNNEIWMEVEYLDDGSSPQGSFATSGLADFLATATAHAADTSTWGGSTTDFKMEVTITPALKGPFTIYVKAAAASATFYIDPKPVLS